MVFIQIILHQENNMEKRNNPHRGMIDVTVIGKDGSDLITVARFPTSKPQNVQTHILIQLLSNSIPYAYLNRGKDRWEIPENQVNPGFNELILGYAGPTPYYWCKRAGVPRLNEETEEYEIGVEILLPDGERIHRMADILENGFLQVQDGFYSSF